MSGSYVCLCRRLCLCIHAWECVQNLRNVNWHIQSERRRREREWERYKKMCVWMVCVWIQQNDMWKKASRPLNKWNARKREIVVTEQPKTAYPRTNVCARFLILASTFSWEVFLSFSVRCSSIEWVAQTVPTVVSLASFLG